MLMKFIDKKEVKKVIFDIKVNKSLRLYGYGSGIFREVWVIVGDEIIKAVIEFFETGKFFKYVNFIFVVLIFKTEVVQKAGDYRLIVCCNVSYNVIFKVFLIE